MTENPENRPIVSRYDILRPRELRFHFLEPPQNTGAIVGIQYAPIGTPYGTLPLL